ncbi:MAG: hypothetical protein MRY77_08820 [Rhodobacteraceae bacterium]|nr:hypothetical protein [Paracoccaceae bacterium]
MDDYSNDPTTTGRLELGSLSHGVIETSGDRDWFAVELEAETIYRFEIFGNASLGSALYGKTLASKALVLWDENGLLQGNGFGGSHTGQAGLVYSPEETGTYFLSAGGNTGNTGSYALKLDTIVPDSGQTMADALPLSLGQTVVQQDGSNAGIPNMRQDNDWLRIDLEAGVSYAVELNRFIYPSSASFSHVEVVTEAGEVVARTVSGKPEGTEFSVYTAPETGTYFLNVIGTAHRSPEPIYAITLREAVEITGTAGNDWLSVPAADDTLPVAISGGAGQDMISFAARDEFSVFGEGVLVNLETGLLSARAPGYMRLAMDSIEHATGSNFADTLYGHDGSERLRGLGGRDQLFGSEGADRIDGGGGRDLLDYRYSDNGVSASLLKGRGWSGDAARDQIRGIEDLRGSNHDDFLWGDRGNNRLDGGFGDDTLMGNGGDDYLIGGHGTDVILYAGNQADYTITRAGFRTDVVHNDGGDGHDIIAHAEILRFADGDLIL